MGKILNIIKKTGEKFLDALFPKDITCIGCGSELTDDDLREYGTCRKCLAASDYIGGKVIPLDYHQYLTTRLFSVFVYEGFIRKLVVSCKDGGKNYLAYYFARYICHELKDNYSGTAVDGIVYIPSDKKKLLKRGYSHTKLIAAELSKLYGVPVIGCLKKKDGIKDQTEAKNRIENIKDAFILEGDVEGKKLFIVDDVITSGATVREASRLLTKNGAFVCAAVTFSVSPVFAEMNGLSSGK